MKEMQYGFERKLYVCNQILNQVLEEFWFSGLTIDETFNIHKKINCIFPFFKSKFLCKKGIHNYSLYRDGISKVKLKCNCCSKEEKLKVKE